jgi:hypothetical protein
MLIWLGKQFLGQSDKNELSGKDGGPIQAAITVEFVKAKPSESK